MKSSPNPIFNNVEYQSKNCDVATCGRHVISRLICFNAGYNGDEYFKLIKKVEKSEKKPPDIIVCDWIKLK